MEQSNIIAEITVSYRPSISNKPTILSSLDAYNVLLPFFQEDTLQLQESFVALYLNRANRAIGCYKLSHGGITSTVVDIRLLLSVALKTVASGIIIAHNHPSSNPRPSKIDTELSKRIKDAAKLMDINVMDHIIICPENIYASLADEGIL